jgi:D-arabinose 1-dehydrogenase-like Zn-dependent alcohol dehydrogenase
MSGTKEGTDEILNLDQADALAYGSKTKNKETKFGLIPFKLRKLAPDEITLKTLYTSLRPDDIALRSQSCDLKMDPHVPGDVFVGEIIEVGCNVTEFKKHDIVGCGILEKSCGYCTYCLEGNQNLCESIDDIIKRKPGLGAWATHWQGNLKHAQKISQEIPLELCASLMDVGPTIFAPMMKHIIPKKHKELAVIGIGGLGHLAIKYGKAMGLNVTAITTYGEKTEDIMSLGADAVYTSDNLNELIDSRKIDVGMYCFGEKNIDLFIKILKKRGVFVVLGAPNLGEDFLKIDKHFLIHNEISVVGSLFGNADDLRQCLDFSARHRVFPNVELYDFDDFDKAIEKLNSGKAKYTVVVKCLTHKNPRFNN